MGAWVETRVLGCVCGDLIGSVPLLQRRGECRGRHLDRKVRAPCSLAPGHRRAPAHRQALRQHRHRRRAAGQMKGNEEQWWLQYTNKAGDKEREIAKVRARQRRTDGMSILEV